MFDEIIEVAEAVKNNRFEIVLKNVEIESNSEAANGAQKRVFEKMPQLNFLSLTSCSLSNISSHIQLCKNLISLVLPRNQLTSLPDVFDCFPKLKLIDVSHNEINSLPPSISRLAKLESLIVENNKLSENDFPDLSNLSQLHVFNASHNLLTEIPSSLMNSGLAVKLHTIDLSNNSIEKIPDEFSLLKQTKDLKINNNRLKEIPPAVAYLPKLKVLDLSQNSFKDTRFGKLTNDKRSKVSAVIAYIAKNGTALELEKNLGKDGEEKENKDKIELKPLVIRTGLENLIVHRHPSVSDVRPYLVCCVINNVDLNSDSFRKFITLQTKIHASSLCENRAICAIGTHRFDSFHLPLDYLALSKEDLYIRALNKKSSVSATELLDTLLRDAELARKRSKRSTVDPLHRYLHIIKDDTVLACLVDSQKIVISLPPITNSDLTKLTTDTTRIFVEISSKTSLDACKKAMDELIVCSLPLFPDMTLEQVRVVESENLISIYPGKNDLSQIQVERISA